MDELSRIIRGGWQLSDGHNSVSRVSAIDDMVAYARAGITTFDCADIYIGVEELIGEFLRMNADLQVRVHTKCVPNQRDLLHVDEKYLRRAIDASRARLGVETLDLVQFHWWDYAVGDPVAALEILHVLKGEGKICELGTTNFDTAHLRRFVEAGIPIVSNQAQYSLLDRRVARTMAPYCMANNISIVCYGTVAGGLLSDRYLGVAEPSAPFENRSLEKYMQIVQRFGGWALFQELLRVLRTIADKYSVDIATVASRYVLDQPGVSAVIIGSRNTQHLADQVALARFTLDEHDQILIRQVLAQANDLPGEPFEFERAPQGPEASMMWRNLLRIP